MIRMEAWIYVRYSTADQAKGSSVQRQLEDCRAMCSRRGWYHSPERELIDDGLSAFTAMNRADGSKLGWIERQVAEGRLGNGSVLVVERLDRLSRQEAPEVFSLMKSLTDGGLSVATVDSDQIYATGQFTFQSMVTLLVKAQVSHEESEKKSRRLAAAWAMKRARLAQGDKNAFTGQCPAWLEVSPEDNTYRVRPDRVATVQEIFRLANSGMGKHLIAATLNERQVATWARGDRRATGWQPSYIQKILRSRATMGEFQAHRLINGKRLPEGDPIQDCFPGVIDPLTFATAQAERLSRRGKGGRRGQKISNLFSGLARCAACGARMAYVNKGKPAERYLVCDHALRRMGCTNRTHVNYPAVERDMLESLLSTAIWNRIPAGPSRLVNVEQELAVVRDKIATHRQREANLIELYAGTGSATVEVALRSEQDTLSALVTTLASLGKEREIEVGGITPEERRERVRRFADQISDADPNVSTPARAEAAQAFRAVVQSMTCDADRVLHVKVARSETTIQYDTGGKRISSMRTRHRNTA